MPVAVFSNDAQPITIAVVADMSGGIFDLTWYAALRNALVRMVDELGPQDRARIGTFGGSEIAMGFHLTSDHAELKRVISEEVWPQGGPRHLWNAVGAAMMSLKNEPGRRVVLVLTNGPDSMNDIPGMPGASYVDKTLRDSGFMIYAVVPFPRNQMLLNPDGDIQPRVSLPDLVDLSGGGYIQTTSSDYMRRPASAATDPLLMALPRVIDELRHQYSLGFVPRQRDGREGKLDVRVSRDGAVVTARKTYRAPTR